MYFIKFWVNPGHGFLICNIKETDSLYSKTKLLGLFHNEIQTFTLNAISMNNKMQEVKIPLFSLIFTP